MTGTPPGHTRPASTTGAFEDRRVTYYWCRPRAPRRRTSSSPPPSAITASPKTTARPIEAPVEARFAPEPGVDVADPRTRCELLDDGAGPVLPLVPKPPVLVLDEPPPGGVRLDEPVLGGVLLGGGVDVAVLVARQPVCAGFVRPMPWLRSHSYPALESEPPGSWPFGFLLSALPTQPAHGLPPALPLPLPFIAGAPLRVES